MRQRTFLVSLFLLAFVVVTIVQAAPLRYYPVTLTQPNGATLQCFASGDEFHNWLHDKDYFTIMQDPNTGYYVYATFVRGVLVPSSYVAGTVNPASVGLRPGMNLSATVIAAKRTAMLE